MKKIAIAALLTLLLLSSCSLFDRTANVRFQNVMTDLAITYGLRFGEAVFEGSLNPGNSTDYYETESGSYSVEAMTATGTWITISADTLTVSGGREYTISLSGSSTTSIYFQLLED